MEKDSFLATPSTDDDFLNSPSVDQSVAVSQNNSVTAQNPVTTQAADATINQTQQPPAVKTSVDNVPKAQQTNIATQAQTVQQAEVQPQQTAQQPVIVSQPTVQQTVSENQPQQNANQTQINQNQSQVTQAQNQDTQTTKDQTIDQTAVAQGCPASIDLSNLDLSDLGINKDEDIILDEKEEKNTVEIPTETKDGEPIEPPAENNDDFSMVPLTETDKEKVDLSDIDLDALKQIALSEAEHENKVEEVEDFGKTDLAMDITSWLNSNLPLMLRKIIREEFDKIMKGAKK